MPTRAILKPTALGLVLLTVVFFLILVVSPCRTAGWGSQRWVLCGVPLGNLELYFRPGAVMYDASVYYYGFLEVPKYAWIVLLLDFVASYLTSAALANHLLGMKHRK